LVPKCGSKKDEQLSFFAQLSFSSGTDAAGYSRNDVSAVLKLALSIVHGCTMERNA